jgi:hypothetical protein
VARDNDEEDFFPKLELVDKASHTVQKVIIILEYSKLFFIKKNID